MLHTTDVEKVILVSTIPSNLALDAPVNEETKKFNLLETEQKSHSDMDYGYLFSSVFGTPALSSMVQLIAT